jgi:tryptophan-rich hypothetical protein
MDTAMTACRTPAGALWQHQGMVYFDRLRMAPCVPSKMSMNPLHPKKLLLTKWTAVKPLAKNKHFLVSKVILPEPPATAIEWVELEAVYSKAVTRIDWQQLRDPLLWRQGWV